MCSTLVTISSKGDLPTLKRVLAGEFDEFTEDDVNEALLRTACHGYHDCLMALLAHGADADYEDLDGDTPLMLAASNNHVEVVRRLVRHGCDIDARSDRGRTALHMAVWNNRPRIVRFLLSSHCSVNVRDRYGDTPLMLSARRGFPDIMKMLLGAGSDVNKTSNEKETALHYGARYGHRACVELLLDCGSADVDARTMWGLTPLMMAANRRCSEVALELVGAGASIASRDRADKSVLHYAVKNDLTTLADWLLELGADPDVADSDGNSPLIEALVAGTQSTVGLLVRFGCRARDVVGHATVSGEYRWCTPLELAVHRGHARAARLLHAAGCDFSQFLVPVDPATLADRLSASTVEWISRCVGQPRSLVDILRIVIREALDVRQQDKLNALPLPPALITFLAFADEREFDD